MRSYKEETIEQHIILKNKLKILNLNTVCEIFATEAEKAAVSNISYIEYLTRLIEEQIATKIERSINYRIRSAKFPALKTIEGFDFRFQNTIDEKQIKQLCEFSFIEKAENILFIGPPGVGKTHLTIGIGIKACERRIRTLFLTAEKLIENLMIAKLSKNLQKEIENFSRYPLLLIDELGYMPINKEGANLFFQLISRIYEKTSVIITSNKSFKDWGEIFQDDVIAAAIIDRLIHHSHIFKIIGKSYRAGEKIIDNEK